MSDKYGLGQLRHLYRHMIVGGTLGNPAEAARGLLSPGILELEFAHAEIARLTAELALMRTLADDRDRVADLFSQAVAERDSSRADVEELRREAARLTSSRKRDRSQPFTHEEFEAIEARAKAEGDELTEQMAGVLIDTEIAFDKLATINGVLADRVRAALALGRSLL